MKFSRNMFLLFIIFVVIISLSNFIRPRSRVKETKLPYSQFLKMVESHKISKVSIRGRIIEWGPGNSFHTYAPADPELIKTLRQNEVDI